MAFPNSVTSWFIGGSDDWKKVGSGPAGYHRAAYEFISDNGTTLTYRIYHQVGLYLTSHIMTGYSGKLIWTINGTSMTMQIKNGDHRWNSGPPGSSADQAAVKHYSANGTSIHTYTVNDQYGLHTNPVYRAQDITFPKSADGVVYLSLSYAKGDTGNSTLGVPDALKLTMSSVRIDTGRPAYTAPSYSISDVSPSIGTYNNTNFTVKYTISGGTNNIDWAIAKIYNSSNSHIASIDLSKSKGTNMTKSFKLPSACTDGQQYKVSVRFSDSHSEYETGKINIYTYRTPKVDNVIMTETSFSRYRK